MISKYTILERFIKQYGNPIPAKTLGKDVPFSVGSYNHLQGITTDIETVIRAFITKYYVEHHKIPKMQSVVPLSLLAKELKYQTLHGECFFPTDKIIDALHILESKPFSHCMITYFPEDALPMVITRVVEDSTVGILLSPYILPVKFEGTISLRPSNSAYKGNPWLTGKFKPTWVKQFHAFSSLWLVELENGERLIKCHNPECNFEINIDDYYQVYYTKHPMCMCQCNAWECPMNCYNIRRRKESQKAYYELSKKKHFWKKKFT